MKCLTAQEANEHLARIGMQIGSWNQIADIEVGKNSESSWVNYSAPVKSQELFTFAEHAAGWLPKGDWKILQIDNSTCLDAVQTKFLGRLLFGSESVKSLDENRTFLFEFGKSQDEDRNIELLIAQLIFAFLLFESHVHFVSSRSDAGERLAIQDGCAYFCSKDKDLRGVEILLRNFERKPLMSPQWVVEIIAAGQE